MGFPRSDNAVVYSPPALVRDRSFEDGVAPGWKFVGMGWMVNFMLLSKCEAQSLGIVDVSVFLICGKWVSSLDGDSDFNGRRMIRHATGLTHGAEVRVVEVV